ncbi:AraC family transcriptional regulator [Paenibacillus daejeonensis]|uniref:AraC family transcriptional regulator n=1 Tax=Paenibacillus daejeonensis TaxID=135193 RepID=UPI0003777C7B|nr:AraC family transcriptional regulator [Paenibacillus daejeonensis]
MYTVMLVDDDYPVLDLIHYAVDWDSLGLQVIGLHQNGADALAAARQQMPDILVTDIGMPQMDGLELIAQLKQLHPELCVAILSCHDEFDYARKAVKLQVQDYLLKDTLDPSDMTKLLSAFIADLDEKEALRSRQLRMEWLMDRNRSLMKEKFLRMTLEQPLWDADKWQQELEGFGLPLARGTTVIPILGVVDDAKSARLRFQSDEVLRFAVDNVLEETLRDSVVQAVHFPYDAREIVVLAAFQGGLKVNGYEAAAVLLKLLQSAVGSLKLSVSFIMGRSCSDPAGIKAAIAEIKQEAVIRFYRSYGSILTHKAHKGGDYDLFANFGQAGDELRQLILGKRVAELPLVIHSWLEGARQHQVDPAIVRDWVLKVLLDLRLKLQSVLNYRPAAEFDLMPNEALTHDTLIELQEWMIAHCLSIIAADHYAGSTTKRTEIAEACAYVSRHLDRKITLEEVAESLFMNPSYFSRLFKKETGETFIEYVTRMKMHRARELLKGIGTPVGKICETLGYDNQSYFIKLFKSAVGMTPAEYRTQAQ